MLIPVTHFTQYVAECAKCGFSGQASEHDPGPPTEFSVPSLDPIWPSELHYARRRARIRAVIYMYATGLLHTEIV